MFCTWDHQLVKSQHIPFDGIKQSSRDNIVDGVDPINTFMSTFYFIITSS